MGIDEIVGAVDAPHDWRSQRWSNRNWPGKR
jgi:hypothetical protein